METVSEASIEGLLRRSSVYFVSTLIAQASSLVIFPLYTRLLGTADYGFFSLLWSELITALWFALTGVGALVLQMTVTDAPALISAKIAVAAAFAALTVLSGGLSRDARAPIIECLVGASRHVFRLGFGKSVGQK